LQNLSVKLDGFVDAQGRPQLRIVDVHLPVTIQIARTGKGVVAPDGILAATRAHEQKHADALARPINLAKKEIDRINEELRSIDTTKLTPAEVKILVEGVRKAVESQTIRYLQLRLALEIVRQNLHLDHLDEKKTKVEGGRFVEDPNDFYEFDLPDAPVLREIVRGVFRFQLADDKIGGLRNNREIKKALNAETTYLDGEYKEKIAAIVAPLRPFRKPRQ
jgi:hypothetical protein